jgi:hypothetical protein
VKHRGPFHSFTGIVLVWYLGGGVHVDVGKISTEQGNLKKVIQYSVSDITVFV